MEEQIMKKIFTIAAILFSLTSIAADYPRPAKISISSNDRAFIQVKIDGRKFNLDRNTFALNNIRPGYHTIEIVRVENTGMFRSRRARVIYNSSMYIAPSQIVDIDINRFGQGDVRKKDFDRVGRDGRYDAHGRGRDYDRNDRDRDGRNDRNGRF
jgi:hypothetical protein